MMRRVFTSVLGLSVLCAGTAAAQLPNEDLMCRPDTPTLDKYAYLRALSLDLRGTVPSPAEYRALDSQPDVPEGLIDSWLGSEAFVQRAGRAPPGPRGNNNDNQRIVDKRANKRTTPRRGGLGSSPRGSAPWRGGGGGGAPPAASSGTTSTTCGS